MPSRYFVVPSLLAAVAIAGCGANNSDTAHVVPPPTQSQTLTYSATATSSSSSSTSSSSTASIVTPKTGPLSKEPKITLPKTAAPKTLVKTDLITGTGATVHSGDTVTVNYVGELYKGGKIFDASWNHPPPFTTAIGTGAVIKGWDQGVVGMRVGGRRELIIPPALGYGASGSPPTIPANATLIFVIDLLALRPAGGATSATGATVAPGAAG